MPEKIYIIKADLLTFIGQKDKLHELIESCGRNGKYDLRLATLTINAFQDYVDGPCFEMSDVSHYRGSIIRDEYHRTSFIITSYEIFPTLFFEAIESQFPSARVSFWAFSNDFAGSYTNCDSYLPKLVFPLTYDGLYLGTDLRYSLGTVSESNLRHVCKGFANLDGCPIWKIKEYSFIPDEKPKDRPEQWNPVTESDPDIRISDESLQRYFPALYAKKDELMAQEQQKRQQSNQPSVAKNNSVAEKRGTGSLLKKIIKTWLIATAIIILLLIMLIF